MNAEVEHSRVAAVALLEQLFNKEVPPAKFSRFAAMRKLNKQLRNKGTLKEHKDYV